MTAPAMQVEVDRLAVAHHEAGHAVAHVLAGGEVTSMRFEGAGGVTSTREDGPVGGDVHGWLVMTLAGMEAEVAYLVRSGHDRSAAWTRAEAGGASDLARFGKAARGSGFTRSGVAADAARLVSGSFGWIERLAHRLVKAGRLSGREVHNELKGLIKMTVRAVLPPAKIRKAVAKGRPVKGANFEPKRVRKQVRKSLIRAAVTNKVADKKVAFKERAAFYRSLRELKMRRRKIAAEFGVLATMTDGLQREVNHVEDRFPGVSAGLLEEASMLVKDARAAVSATADEMAAFSRRKVYFTEAVRP